MTTETDFIIATPTGGSRDHTSYVDWPAIIAGIVLASAVSLVLLTFGAAIGFSFTDFRSPEGVAPVWVAIAAATWLLWVEVSSFMLGGYLTGRLRRRFSDATEHESDVRDGAHGLLVWAGSLVVGAVIATGGLSAAVGAIGNIAGTATVAASNTADEAALDPNAYFIDTLFRSEPAAATTAPAPVASTTPAPVAGTTPAPVSATAIAPVSGPAAGNAVSADTRGEVGRILASAVTGPVPDADKAYIATLVSRETGLAPADAEARVDTVLTQIDEAKAKAVETAENARKVGVLAAFLTAAAFLVGAAGAYWAASMGGRHRDENTIFADIFRRY